MTWTWQRGSLIAIAFGLFFIVQPWSEGFFAFGFPFTLAALISYNAAGWKTGDRAEKSRREARRAAARRPAARPAGRPGAENGA